MVCLSGAVCVCLVDYKGLFFRGLWRGLGYDFDWLKGVKKGIIVGL